MRLLLRGGTFCSENSGSDVKRPRDENTMIWNLDKTPGETTLNVASLKPKPILRILLGVDACNY